MAVVFGIFLATGGSATRGSSWARADAFAVNVWRRNSRKKSDRFIEAFQARVRRKLWFRGTRRGASLTGIRILQNGLSLLFPVATPGLTVLGILVSKDCGGEQGGVDRA